MPYRRVTTRRRHASLSPRTQRVKRPTAAVVIQCAFLVIAIGSSSLPVATGFTKTTWESVEPEKLASVGDSQVDTSQAAGTELRQGASLKREITKGQAHVFGVALEAGQYMTVVVEQQGIDLMISTFNPDGSPQMEFDNPTGLRGRKFVSVMAGAAGVYRLEVRPVERWAAAGAYEISVEAARLPTPADEKRLEAERSYADGRRLSAAASSRDSAAKSYERAITLWQEAERLSNGGNEDRYGQANALQSLGKLYKASGNLGKAIESYDRALQLRREMADRQGEASTLSDVAAAYRDLDAPEKALQPYEKSLQISAEVGNRRGEASALHNIGFVYFLMRRPDDALKFYGQALSIRQAENDLRGEALTLNGIAGVYKETGETQKALDSLNGVEQKFREVGDYTNEAVAINNIGLIYDDWGQLQDALNQYDRALSIHRSLPDRERNRRAEALTIVNISLLLATLGDTAGALDKLNDSLNISRALNEPSLLGVTLSAVGYVHFLRNDPEEALKFYQSALPFYEKAQDTFGQSHTLTVMGMAYTTLGQRQSAPSENLVPSQPQEMPQTLQKQERAAARDDSSRAPLGDVRQSVEKYQRALEYYEKALQLQRASQDRQGQAITLDKMGDVYTLLRDMQKGLSSYKAALQLWQLVSDRNGEAITLYNIARTERARGDLVEAHKWITAALNIVESLRTSVISRQLRISYFTTKQNYYELDIDVKMQLHKSFPAEGYDAAALQSSERARARALIDMLSEAKIDIREGVDPGLIDREEGLRRKLNDKASLQTQLLNGPHTKAEADTLAKEITQLTTEDDDLQMRIKAQSPGYAAIKRPQPRSLEEIQQLLDDDTLLLEFALGAERSYIWVVSNRAIYSHELPKRDMIEEAARRFYELVTAPQVLPNDTPQERRARVASAASQYQAEAKSLSRTLLGAVADKLENKRLLIVADGALQYIPFTALPSPISPGLGARRTRGVGGPGGADDGIPLIIEHEIIALPSASTLAVLRSETEKHERASGAVAVLADPVFDVNDQRLLTAKKSLSQIGENGSGGRSADTPDEKLLRSGFNLRRLPQTAQEAEAIKNAASPWDVMVATGFEASRRTIMSPQLRQYRIIHFATHGVLDNVHPELSGVVLSLVDAQGRAQDGMLRLHDIYNLKLPAELVVLSACDTGLGKVIKGEGLVGLTRGFMYAGSPRVVATLWKVDDYATSLLMEKFYQQMFKMKLSPAAALRQSQVEMMRQERWRDPFYWAAFVLHGEPNNMQ
jgi:CHAT domain-containing protein/tetratricopeptide (TPR) repeat protein